MARISINGFSHRRGFTLIELLVVIAIIGVLATIVLVSLNSARVKARNAQRNSTIKQLITAFNMAADAANGTFPNTSGAWVCVSATCYGGWSGYGANAAVDTATAQYIKKPDDPTDSTRGIGGYLYNSSWSGGVYLNWLLEPVPVTSTVCGPGGSAYNYTANYVQCVVKVN